MKYHTIFTLSLLLLFAACSNDKTVVAPGAEPNILAGQKWKDVQALMALVTEDAGLFHVESEDVRPDGTSREWSFQFMSPFEEICYCHATFGEAVYDSCIHQIFWGPALISHDWFDSDDALRIAERNGGREFREAHPDYRIEAFLSEPGLPNPVTYWAVTYRSQADETYITITMNAVTGEIREETWR